MGDKGWESKSKFREISLLYIMTVQKVDFGNGD